ncbi:PAQR family membrane homeostasis protein TrhA [Bacillus sp. 2205SS5-2]|uniref:PAQR family membrane homeostasis protein TrhA n=1 Tax=Bacillus sp. 2205SS5-2 TaxID=3109031 RepID=UPI003007DB20
MGTYIREPINALTHLVGAMLAFAGLLLLVIKASITTSSALSITAVILFGVSMILLYAASATYHSAIATKEVIAFLRRVDHSMIFVFIAGTYTPICLISLQGTTGWILFVVIHLLALLGVFYKLIWFRSPRWLSTLLYIAMGWLIIMFSFPLTTILGVNGMLLLLIGGIFYTIGGVIYATKPTFLTFKHLGFHEIFHLFILLGSLFHFLCIFYFVL